MVALLILIAATSAPDTPGLGDFKSLPAKNAADIYSAALQRLTKEFKDKSDIARKACVVQLTSAQQAATKAGNLDEAIRIRDAITNLNAQVAESAPAGRKD
jgi:excinuclease UvrABC helicase subunit UvrB